MRRFIVPIICMLVSIAVSARADYKWTQGESETNKVDLLFVFDSSAEDWLSDSAYSNAFAFAKKSVGDMNAALARTDLDKLFTFRLVGVTNISHSFSGCMPAELTIGMSRLESSRTKEHAHAFRKIHKYRDRARADICVVLSNGFTPGVFGGSKPMSEDLSPVALDSYKERAYVFSDISSVFSRHTILHEIGHVMGCGHSPETWVFSNPGPQLFQYSSGCHFMVGTNRYATVMASTSGEQRGMTWTRLPVFSSPNHTFKFTDPKTGEVVDTGVRLGTPDVNDNTRTLRETYPFVANFRVAKKMDVIPVDPNAIKLSVVTGGVEIAGSEIVMRCLTTLDMRIKAEAPVSPKVFIKGLPAGLYYSLYTGRIYGWPEKAGTYKVEVEANNSEGYRAVMKFKIIVKDFGAVMGKRGRNSLMKAISRWRRPWWRRAEQCQYVVDKPLIVNIAPDIKEAGLVAGDSLELKLLSHDGSGWVTGKIAGKDVSGYLQFERFGTGRGTPDESHERIGCLVSFPPDRAKGFAGYARWIDLMITVDGNWHIKTMQFFDIRNP